MNIINKDLLHQFQKHERDNGSSTAQIYYLTKKISNLQRHMLTSRKDLHSLRGLIAMVNRRKKVLRYLKRQDIDLYESVVQSFRIRIRKEESEQLVKSKSRPGKKND